MLAIDLVNLRINRFELHFHIMISLKRAFRLEIVIQLTNHMALVFYLLCQPSFLIILVVERLLLKLCDCCLQLQYLRSLLLLNLLLDDLF